MTKFVIADRRGARAVLVTDHPMAGGRPVLLVQAGDVSGLYGPRDVLRTASAGALVEVWAEQSGRTEAELEAARAFLGQWPEGPQVPSLTK